MGHKAMNINHPAYNTQTRIKGFAGTVLSAPTIRDSAAILRKLAPGLTRAQHGALKIYHRARSEKLEKNWLVIANNAARATWDREWHFTDYKICAIGSEQFSERYKRLLRHCAYNAAKHGRASAAHGHIERYSR